MKKVVLGLSLVALATSCKKLPEGGNKGVLKLEEGVAQHKLEPEENVSKTDSIQKENKVDSASTTH